jgi:hypothetical protein
MIGLTGNLFVREYRIGGRFELMVNLKWMNETSVV